MIETSLNIVFIGDSLAQQWSTAMEEAAVVNDTTRYWESGRDHLNSVAFTKDGGVISLVFLTKLLARHPEGTDFSPTDMELFRDLIINHTRDFLPPNEREQAREIHTDAVILRMMVGWIKLEEVTKETIEEYLDLAFLLTGCEFILLSSILFSNNMVNPEMVQLSENKNALIERVVAEYVPPSLKNNSYSTEYFESYGTPLAKSGGRQHVMLLPVHHLTDALIHVNGQHLDIPENETMAYRLKTNLWDQPQAVVCGKLEPKDSYTCQPNRISIDGIHWCPNAVAGRINAGMACNLNCFFHDKNVGEMLNVKWLEQCSQECNEQYFSLKPVTFGTHGRSAL
eukprot:CAMPEP_0172417956 /NCGR_PEP_ID=MMETSP1064-20121228/4453_1 /TAXON_ID=202472 /ORGANISM="Aulacoseira subarctica , Strain CCAP 1002/5" /LENGTH=339 /DNA_ID=CAMNT_0013156559 /DNA_START=376 /DNA_END=1395 /DNA_ORIENTATION=+